MSDIEAFRADVSDGVLELAARVAWFRAELWRDPRHERVHAFVHDVDGRIARIQDELAQLDAYLRRTVDGEGAPPDTATQRLSRECSALEVELEPIHHPLVAGGGVAGAAAHLVVAAARPVVRELEIGGRWWGPAARAVPYMTAFQALFATLARAVTVKLGYQEVDAPADWP